MIFGSAILLGVLSSLHCMAMCGPIALVTPIVRRNLFTEFISRLLYNLGRTLTYTIIGLMAGLIGQQFMFRGIQNWISIAAGIFILIMVIFPRLNPENWKFISRSKPVKLIKTSIAQKFKTQTFGSIFTIGLLNGLLPCAMVYIALTAAMASTSIWRGGLYMLLFGLGTWPLMFILTSGWQLLSSTFKQNAKRFLPVVVGLVGCLLILRGLQLDIPYLSPVMPTDPTMVTECH